MNHRGKFRKQFLSLLLSVTVYILSYSSSYSLDDETTRDLQEFIQSYVEDLITAENPGSKVEITAPNLEKRINMTSCDGFLFAELIKKDLNRRNNSIDLMCEDPDRPWDSIVPIRIKYLKPVVASVESIGKGQQLSDANISVVYVESSRLTGNYFTSTELLLGAKSKRELSPNSIIKNEQICLVCKDDLVDLEAGTSEVTIKVQGKALEDGALNQEIRVTNLISNKTVRAKVVGVGHVKIEVK